MSLSSGSRLGAYEILGPIGAGGMGQVYRARDISLHREVAIKVLSDTLEPVPERLARFEREAKLLASLNHPNIATIHGLEEAGGGEMFLVLELVEGETLAERIARGPISLDRALPLFDQIARGLEAAHEKGIIHRDLKPANIQITPDGRVKILDFGLAKVFETPEAGQVDLSHSPTLTREGTRTGVILGTAGYMSPEQARGDPVDKQTDIWSFGCCLYEALTGKPAFGGATVTDIIASVVKTEPDWERLPADTPLLVRRVLKRCLEKDASRRIHDIADARLELGDPMPTLLGGEHRETAARSRWLLYGAVLLGLAGVVSQTGLWWRGDVSADRPVTRAEIETGPLRVGARSIAFSPDGAKLAYVPANEDAIYIRHMDSAIATRLAPTKDLGPTKPVFSPDGEWVLFEDQLHSKLAKVEVNGGRVIALCDVGPGVERDHDWKMEDSIVFIDREELFEIPARGGAPKVMKAEGSARWGRLRQPDVLPGGRAVLVTTVSHRGRFSAAIHDTETGERRVVVEDASRARYVPTGHLVFLRNEVLYAVGFDAERLEVLGEPIPVVEGIHVSMTNFSAQYAFSDSGSLAYVPSDSGAYRRRLVWVDRDGNVEPIQTIARRIVNPRASPDGALVALSVFDGIRPSVWLAEVARETLTPFETEEWSMSPSWMPDGRAVSFVTRDEILVKSLDGGRAAGAVPVKAPSMPWDAVWSSKGDALLTSFDNESFNIERTSLGSAGELVPFVSTSRYEGLPGFSPDGRWVVYASTETGSIQIYAQAFEEGAQRHQVSTDGGADPVWSPDGREIFYRRGAAMMSVEVQTEPVFRASPPRVLFEGDFLDHDHPWKRNWDVSPDGKRFLMIQSEEEPVYTKVNIVLNWFEELKRLVPVGN